MSIKCVSCGGKTIGDASNCWEALVSKPLGIVTKCYAKWECGKWVAGCDKIVPADQKNFVGCLINDQNLRNYKE